MKLLISCMKRSTRRSFLARLDSALAGDAPESESVVGGRVFHVATAAQAREVFDAALAVAERQFGDAMTVAARFDGTAEWRADL